MIGVKLALGIALFVVAIVLIVLDVPFLPVAFAAAGAYSLYESRDPT